MKPWHRGIAVAALHSLIVLSLAGKYALDRDRLPRVWVETAPVDPNLPIRGRYVSLRLLVDVPPGTGGYQQSARLSISGGRLFAEPVAGGGGTLIMHNVGAPWTVAEPVAFFIPEHAADPSRRAPGERLWVEVSLPRQGPPRPLRLGVRKDGVLQPLALE